MSSWVWVAGGLLLLGAEVLAPGGFFILFFGIGAILTGAATATGIVTASSAQWLLFTISSIAGLLLFRGKLLARMSPPGAAPRVDTLVGEIAQPLAEIAPGGVGRVMLRGSTWEARNDSAGPLAASQRCRVVRVSGLQLGVVPEA
jgi:membrane protein implicated in regulation of membrane protease activity